MKSIIISIACFVLFGFTLFTSNWEFKKEKNGIKVYTKKVEGSKYEKCKAVTTVKADLNAVYAFIKNPLNYKKFSERIESIEVIKETKDKILYYMKVDMPWPIYNRDGIYEITIKHKTDTEALFVNRARPELLPEQEGYIRIHLANTFYKLTKKENNNCQVHFEQHTDPNGDVPAWVSNYYLIDGPIGNLTVIKDLLEQTDM